MATESPLFQSSMELFGHSIEHFNGSSELDRKMVILHLANAVELLLKDLLLDLGDSIYKNPKETVTVQACVTMLQDRKIALPHFNKMELLIDERNALQHRFGSPNELTTVYYMDATVEFFRSMLDEHYDLNLEEILPQFVTEMELEAFRLRRPSDESELANLKRLARVHPVGAFLSASRYFEKQLDAFFEQIDEEGYWRRRPSWAALSHRLLERVGVDLGPELSEQLDEFRRKRNLVTHGRMEPSEGDVVAAVDLVEKLERKLDGVDKEAIRRQSQELRELERQRRYVRVRTEGEPEPA